MKAPIDDRLTPNYLKINENTEQIASLLETPAARPAVARPSDPITTQQAKVDARAWLPRSVWEGEA